MNIIKEFFDFVYERSRNEPMPEILDKEKGLAIFVFGSPASGKSTFTEKYLLNKVKNCKIFNPDDLNVQIGKKFSISQLNDVKEINPEDWKEFQDIIKHKLNIDVSSPKFYQKTLKYGKNNDYNTLTDKILNSWIKAYTKNGNNFIYDTSGNDINNIKKYVELCRQNNYDVIFIKIRKDFYSTLNRNLNRERSVDLPYLLNSYLKTMSNTKIFKELNPDSFYIVFNKDIDTYKFYKVSGDKLLKKKGHRWV